MVNAQEWYTARNGGSGWLDLFITTDQNLRYQQNLTGRQLAILVLKTTSWPKIRRHIGRIQSTVNTMSAGAYLEISFDVSP